MPQDHATPPELERAPSDATGRVPSSARKPPAVLPDGSTSADRLGAAAAALPQGRERPRSWVRTWVFGLAMIAMGAAVIYTIHYFTYAGAHPSTDDAYVQGDTTIISAKVFGRVTRVLVAGYQHVRKGELLVELHPVDAEIAVQQARAGLDAAWPRVRQAEAALTAQRHQATASLAQARAAQVAATAHVPQSQTAVTLEDQTIHESISIARAQLSAAGAQVNAARSNLVKARNDLTRSGAVRRGGNFCATGRSGSGRVRRCHRTGPERC